MIREEIYSKIKKANDWRLGELHKEWNAIFNKYQGINIKAPRSHLKTFFFFEVLALRECKFNPGIEIKYFTSGDTMATEKLSHIKDYAELPFFKELLNGADVNSKTEIRFSNGSKISTQGFGGKARGGHPDIIILDDIIDTQVLYSDDWNRKVKERLATEILPMAEPHTKIIIIGTLQREDDIYSVDFSDILEDILWFSKSYDAIVDERNKITLFPEKWNWDLLMAKKREIIKFAGEKWFLKEYRNTSVDLLGEIIKQEWKKEYEELPNEELSIYTGWDLSVGKDIEKGDYTAKVTFALTEDRRSIYILDVYRARIDFSKRIKEMIKQGEEEDPVCINVENNVFQADTVKVAKDSSNLNIKGVRTSMNKIEKFNQMLVPLFENGRVYLKKGDKTQEEFWRELCSLPRGKNDDMADAFCIGLKGVLVTDGSGFFDYMKGLYKETEKEPDKEKKEVLSIEELYKK